MLQKIRQKIHKDKQKLTNWEWDALNSKYNLADGHAHQQLTSLQNKIVENLPSLFSAAEKTEQIKIQSEFEKEFFKVAGQNYFSKISPPLYNYACSLSIEVVANYLRLENKTVTLIHPTFDNLADILKRHNVKTEPISEKNFFVEIKKIKTDCLFLVCPNNPTGFELTREEFIEVVEFCKVYKKILILDCSFRFYSQYTKWDQYKLLKEKEVEFIVFEDTGKTWPTLELKLGITLASPSIYQKLKDINDDFLLNVSPFTFKLLTEYIKAEANKGANSYSVEILKNRTTLQKSLKDTSIEIENEGSKLSVAWLRLPNHWKSSNFSAWLEGKNLYVLPGGPFYWNDKELGERYIRIALARPTAMFSEAVERLKKSIFEYEEGQNYNS